jgi:hypothetical protein
VSTLLGILIVSGLARADAQAPKSVWGYVDLVEGQSVTLDDGTVVKLTDGTKVVGIDGSEGTPADIVKGLRVEFALDAAGNATRADLLPKPPMPEYYLTGMTVRGATITVAEVKGRGYPRSLSATKATFASRPDCVALVAGVAYLPPKEAKAPGSVRFTIVNAASDTLYQKTVSPGESAEFRLNLTQGQPDTLTLLVTAPGDAPLQPEWCLWLDPRLVGPTPGPGQIALFQTTVRALVANLKQALGGKQPPGPVAIALFTGIRVPDEQTLRLLQEDLVVAMVGAFQVAGKSAQRPELGQPLNDGQKGEIAKMGAKCVLVGSVSYRGDGLVVNSALVDVTSGEILATARAWQ